jgi:hypothetical protein
MALFGDANLQTQYDNILSHLSDSGAYTPLSMPEQTLDGITEQLAQIYRPQVERAIAQRYGATKQQKAAIDVDAASRGVGTSTWVTDAKNRIMNAEAADIAGLESDYISQLSGDALKQYQNYLGDKLKLDQYNQQLQAALGGAAYDQAMQQYGQGMIEGTLPYQQLQFQWQQTQNAAKGGGGGGGGSKGSGQYYLGKDGVWYKTQQEAEDSYQIEETPYMPLKDRLISGIGQMQRMYR